MKIPVKWIGTATGILGALWIASNVPTSGWGYLLFTFSSLCWTSVGWRMRELSLVLLHSVFLVINMVGIYRWLIA